MPILVHRQGWEILALGTMCGFQHLSIDRGGHPDPNGACLTPYMSKVAPYAMANLHHQLLRQHDRPNWAETCACAWFPDVCM